VTTVTGRATKEGVLVDTFLLTHGPFHFTSTQKNVHSIGNASGDLMKWLLSIFAGLLGAIGGAFSLYFLVAPVYLLYARLNPVDPGAECARGGGIAWLGIFIGALLGIVLGVKAVLKERPEAKERLTSLRF
jgi:hypothetical protein